MAFRNSKLAVFTAAVAALPFANAHSDEQISDYSVADKSAEVLSGDSVSDPAEQTSSFQAEGHPVTFLIGSGVSMTGVEVAVKRVESKGCKITQESGPIPGMIIVRSNNQQAYSGDAQEAEHDALQLCLD